MSDNEDCLVLWSCIIVAKWVNHSYIIVYKLQRLLQAFFYTSIGVVLKYILYVSVKSLACP
jgi:hypothetical protein